MNTFFDWKETEAITNEYHEFEHCVLTKGFGPFRKGRKIQKIVLNFEDGEFSFFDKNDDEIATGKLEVKAGKHVLEFTSPFPSEEINILIYAYKNAIEEGTAFPYIVVDYANGEVEFERADGKTERMPLSIRPREKNHRYIS